MLKDLLKGPSPFSYNKGQLLVREKLFTKMDEGFGQLLLNSPAGVGKTWTAMNVINEAVDYRLQLALANDPEAKGIRILICAPTHSAKNTLKSKLGKNIAGQIAQLNLIGHVSEIAFSTTSSALNLRLDTDLESGKSYLRPGMGSPKIFRHWDLIIFDEVSLANKKSCAILEYGMETMQLPPFLAMGDSKQLPPVKEKQSLIFSMFDPDDCIELTENERSVGPIEALASKAREQIYYPEMDESNDESVFVHSYDGALLDSAKKSFSEAFSNGEDIASWAYLTFTNKKAKAAAMAIRKAMYGSTDDYIVGEWLRVKNGVKIGDNSELVQVLSIAPTEKLKYKAWQLEVHNPRNGQTEDVVVLASESQEAFQTEVNYYQSLGDIAKAENRFDDAKLFWSERLTLQNAFAILNYSVSMSVHWSQGCTCERAWVDTTAISKASNKAQLLYVAYSRAAKVLHVVGIYQWPNKQKLIDLFAIEGLTPSQARDKNHKLNGAWRLRPNSWRTMFNTAVELGLQKLPH